jgi:hypothetical protein
MVEILRTAEVLKKNGSVKPTFCQPITEGVELGTILPIPNPLFFSLNLIGAVLTTASVRPAFAGVVTGEFSFEDLLGSWAIVD